MRFLIDRFAGQRLASWLAQRGHDVRTTWDSGTPDPGDAAVLSDAVAEGRILVTMDSDFGTLIYVLGMPHAGIVRLPDVPAATRIALMAGVLDRYGADLPGAIVTVRGGRIRISRST